MKAIVNFCIVPIKEGSLSGLIAECEKILKTHKLAIELHANGTNIEGEFAEVMRAIEACHEKLHTLGIPRIHTNVAINTRTDREQSMQDKIKSVEQKL